MRYQVELSHVKWKKCMQMQMAMHCAPVLAGLKPSNAVTLDYIDSKELIQSLAGSDIKCGLIYSKVYDNLSQTKKIFEVYDKVRFQMVKLVEYGKSFKELVDMYTNYQVPRYA